MKKFVIISLLKLVLMAILINSVLPEVMWGNFLKNEQALLIEEMGISDADYQSEVHVNKKGLAVGSMVLSTSVDREKIDQALRKIQYEGSVSSYKKSIGSWVGGYSMIYRTGNYLRFIVHPPLLDAIPWMFIVLSTFYSIRREAKKLLKDDGYLK
jgi:hypothetical protein